MSSLDTLRERGLSGFVRDHPWQFALGVGLVGLALAGYNGAALLPAFGYTFLVGAVLGLAYSHAMDYLAGRRETAARRGGSAVESADAAADPERALHRLRERYAAGELDEAEFEARVERLLETESVESARDHVERRRRDERERERERGRE